MAYAWGDVARMGMAGRQVRGSFAELDGVGVWCLSAASESLHSTEVSAMLTLIKHTVHTVPANKVLVGDVIATKGTVEAPQRLRRVDVIGDGEAIISTPKAGQDTEAFTFGEFVIVVGRVEDRTASVSVGNMVKTPKAKAAPKAKPAAVKVTKVDAIAQTTPTPIHGNVRQATGVKMTPSKVAAAPASSLRTAIRAELRSAIETMVLAEIKSVIAEALA